MRLQAILFAVLLLLALPTTTFCQKLCPAPALGPKKISVTESDKVWCAGLCGVDVNSGSFHPFTSSARVCCSCEPKQKGVSPIAPTTPTPPTDGSVPPADSAAPLPPAAPEAKQLSDKELLGYISLDKGPGTDKDGTVTVRAVVTIEGGPPVLSNQQLVAAVLAFNNCTTVPWYIRAQQPAEPGELPTINPALAGRLNGRRRLLQATGDCATRKEFVVNSADECSTKCDNRANDKTKNWGTTYTADTLLSTYNGNTCCKCRYNKGGSVSASSTDSGAPGSSTAVDDYNDSNEADAPAPSSETSTDSSSSNNNNNNAADAPAPGPSSSKMITPASPPVSSTATGVHFFADSTIQDGQTRDVLRFLRECVANGSFQQWLEAGYVPVTNVDLLFSGVGDIIFGANSGVDPIFGEAAAAPPPSSDDGGSSLSMGAIIGIVVGCACAAILVAAVFAFAASKKRRRNKDINSELLTHRWRLERELAESQRAKYANSRNMTLEDLERQRTLRRSQTANAQKNFEAGAVGGTGVSTTPQSSKSMSRLESMRSALGLGGSSSNSRNSAGGGATPPPAGSMYGVTASSGGDLGLSRVSPPADSPADTQLVGHVDSSNEDIESGQGSSKKKKFGRRLF